DELALDVELRNGRPVGVSLDAFAQGHVLKNVEVLIVDAEIVENLYHPAGETALREGLRALHEEHHVMPLHLLIDPVVDVLRAHAAFPRGSPRLSRRAVVTLARILQRMHAHEYVFQRDGFTPLSRQGVLLVNAVAAVIARGAERRSSPPTGDVLVGGLLRL